MSKAFFFMSTKLYLLLLNTAYKKGDQFIDEIDSIEKLSDWLNLNRLNNISVTEELIFNIQNIRHIIKKIVNKTEVGEAPNLMSLNMFSEKYKTNQLIQIGRSSIDFFRDTVIFDEPYHSILLSFKEDFKDTIK